MALDQATLHKIINRGVAEIVSESEFIKLLNEGKPLRLKMGFDPTRPDLHLGHVVGLRKLRQLQDLGHQLVLIVGDWTAQIGDPSGRSATRSMLSAEEVRSNAETYMRQFFKFVDKAKTEVVWQSAWFGKFNLADVINLTSKFTVAQFLQREDFRKRYEGGQAIAVTELLYPLMQAYDSIVVRSDVEFGGTDQKFNLLVGRELQQTMGQRPQQCFMVPILVGTDGVQKMSKSLNNYIAVEESPNDQYGKVMSLPDFAIAPYFEMLTDIPDAELAEMRGSMQSGTTNPMTLKKRLAFAVVKLLNDTAAAEGAQANFERVHQQGDMPEDVPTYTLDGSSLVDVLVNAHLAASKTEARRLIAQKAVEVNGAAVAAEQMPTLKAGDVIRVGKRRFVKLVG